MTRPLLTPCPSCARHVRVHEASCPFCQATLPSSIAALKGRELPRARLSRAALFALGTSAATAATACGGMTTPSGTPVDSDAAQADGNASSSGGDDDGSMIGAQPHYGAPAEGGIFVQTDAGAEPADAGPSDAASTYDGPMAIASYGLGPIGEDGAIHVLPPYGGPVLPE